MNRLNVGGGACRIRGHHRDDAAEGRHKARSAPDLVREQCSRVSREVGGGHMVMHELRRDPDRE